MKINRERNMMMMLTLSGLLGPAGRHRDLALALVVSRVVRPASKLATLGWWADTTLGEDLGVEVDLAVVPLKYPGLTPWEIWLSEAQERMVIAVNPAKLAELETRCRRHGVEMSDIGGFTGDGVLTVRTGGDVVLEMTTEFLHDDVGIAHFLTLGG